MEHNENVTARIESDRISSMPDEIIHHILSFNDMKCAVQTSVLSTRWRFIWTTLPHLNFGSDRFRNWAEFSKFVNRVLSRRDNQTQVSSLDLNYRGPINKKLMQKIGDYAVSHNVQKVNIVVELEGKRGQVMKGQQLPVCFFSSQSLKHLSVNTDPQTDYSFPLPQSPWDSPALTTIELSHVLLSDNTMCLDLFSKCVSLMNLTLCKCDAYGCQVVKIACPRLVSLTISWCESITFEILAPNLSSIRCEGCCLPILFTDGLNSLEKVNLCTHILFPLNSKFAQIFMNRLYELRNARILTLRGYFVELIYNAIDLLENQASPFCNLKCLIMEGVETEHKDTKPDLTSKVISYLLNSSPTATVIM